MPRKPKQFIPPGRANLPPQEPRRAQTSARQRGYTTAWDKASAAYRRRNPLCCGCHAMGRVEAATVTDHIMPHRGSSSLMWDQGNWQPLCTWHHAVIKQQLEGMHASGMIGPDDLRLDRPLAIAMSMDQMPMMGGRS